MANPEHLAILKQGIAVWNQWRKDDHPLRLDLSKADLTWMDLRNADFSNVNFRGADFGLANLSDADLSEANLRNAKLNSTNLRAASLRGAEFISADLFGADLNEANLSLASLSWANLSYANLHGADLREAYLNWANLTSANLREANLSKTHLSKADFIGAYLDGADLSKATLEHTTFLNVDLSNVKGLDTVFHLRASTIGIDTIYKSRGKIAKIFLRGAGVPENLITHLQELMNTDKEYYPCFISYSTLDEKFVKQLHADLQEEGVRCWFAGYDMEGGRKLYEQINEAISGSEKVLLILSENSMKSEPVRREIRNTIHLEKLEGKNRLFPITLINYEALKEWQVNDSITGLDVAEEIRAYYILDFSAWEDRDAYTIAFSRLLRDLTIKTHKSA